VEEDTPAFEMLSVKPWLKYTNHVATIEMDVWKRWIEELAT
jgi:hypothetical protein